MARIYNFSAGPAVLPLAALEEAQRDLVDYKGSGMSIMEMSHRGKEYETVHNEAVENIRKLLKLPENYTVIFMTGGATAQFALIPMNLRGEGRVADYINTGAWASKAIKEAKLLGKVNVIADTEKDIPTRLPDVAALRFTPGAAYVHITSNETIAGTQWKAFPQTEAPLIADMSSDILSRPIDVNQFGLIYAGAQKNLGPAGVTVVVIRKDLAERAGGKYPMILRYKTHLEENSLHNTPPCFAIYMLALCTRWLLNLGGVDAITNINRDKAAKLYAAIDASGFYKGAAVKEFRSDMNVTFRLPSEALEEQFVKEAGAQKLKGLKGHRSVGGIRASIYNAFPVAGVDALIAFMKDFEKRNG
ncbi:MAG: 3-phosphoserine/phosphohydroxythreonine transaminase [Verrucomicrobia bacterium]|nr:MAG: 3-phosphoserine/phosphohydroxythreonine transaminase [Verrucomicrobiota bacterium]